MPAFMTPYSPFQLLDLAGYSLWFVEGFFSLAEISIDNHEERNVRHVHVRKLSVEEETKS
jgi:hypothetical protein